MDMNNVKPSDMDKVFNNDAQKEAVKHSMINYAVNKAKNESEVIDFTRKFNSKSDNKFKFSPDELEEVINLAKEKFNEKLEKRKSDEIKYIELD